MANKLFFVATVPTNVQGNFIAWSKEQSRHTTIDAAKKAAQALESKLYKEFIARTDFGNGAIRSEDVIIHNGYEIV